MKMAMNRKTQAKKIDEKAKEFLKKNPQLKEALRIFDISYEQYQRTLEGDYHFYTDIITAPRKVKFKK